jgi:hypothetical protein
MESIFNYGKLTRVQLRSELVEVTATLTSRIRESAALHSDYNRSFYPAYAREPSNSVAAKDRAAEFACIDQLNDRLLLDAEVKALTEARDLIVTILPYASD